MILWLDEDAFDIEGPILNGILLWVWHIFYTCANPLTLLIFSLRATYWNHDGTECVLGSKSLENELLWTSVNALVVSPVVQIKGSIIICATNNFNVKLPINICASLNKCSTFVQETPVIHLQQSRITPLRSFPAYSHVQIQSSQAMPRDARNFYAHTRNVPHPHNYNTHKWHLLATASSTPLLRICPSSSGGSRPLEIKMYPLSSESMIPSSRSKHTPPPAKYDPLLQMSYTPSSRSKRTPPPGSMTPYSR